MSGDILSLHRITCGCERCEDFRAAKREQSERREWVYVQRPKEYEMAGCKCGNGDPEWSEFKTQLWCQTCQLDFIPAHNGIFDGPVGIEAMGIMGIYFDRIDLKTNTLLPDWQGISHFILDGNQIKLKAQ